MNKILSCLLVGTMLTVGSAASAVDVDLTCNLHTRSSLNNTSDWQTIRIVLTDTHMKVKSQGHSRFKFDKSVELRQHPVLKEIYEYTDDSYDRGFSVKEDHYRIFPTDNQSDSIVVNRLTGDISGIMSVDYSIHDVLFDGSCSRTQVRF